MRMLLTVAALLLACDAAQAQYSFEYGGRIIRIDPDRGTVSIPGVFDNTGTTSKRAHNDQGKDRARKHIRSNPQAPSEAAPTAPAVAPAASPLPAAPSVTTGNSPAEAIPAAPPPTTVPQAPQPPKVQPDAVAAVPPASGPAAPAALATQPPPPKPVDSVATTALPPALPPPPIQRSEPPGPVPTAVREANSPVGVWLTEENEGKVRIEPCGTNLCGYAVDAKSNQNGEQVLINMKPGKDQKWTGRIVDPDTGSNYDSTIALIGANALRVQGCAFGGMFCGGQTWARLN